MAARQAFPADAPPQWVEHDMGDDYLAPTATRMLFGDVVNAFLRLRSPHDRAAVLEESWERSWPHPGSDLATGFFQLERRLPFPLLLLNGTSVTDGCRVETSIIRTAVNPAQVGEACRSIGYFDLSGTYVPPAGRQDWVLGATKDAARYLCSDIRLSTAALLAARFPYVTPSGRVQCGSKRAFVVDGGYFDNSGLGTIGELWNALEPEVAAANQGSAAPIVPLLIHIDNHYNSTSAPASGSAPHEAVVPLETLLDTRDGHDQDARVEAMLLFGSDAPATATVPATDCLTDRVANLYPREHPGTEAPLGWVMSHESRSDLAGQLQTLPVLVELAKVREWFRPVAPECIATHYPIPKRKKR